jgi:hypothetical protein
MTVASVRYSFTGAIRAPRSVLKDGYISWHDSVSGHWMQLRMFPDELSDKMPHVVDLNTQTTFGKLLQSGMSLRSAVDRVTRTPQRVQRGTEPVATATRSAAGRVQESSAACAHMWRARVQQLKKSGRMGRRGRRQSR